MKASICAIAALCATSLFANAAVADEQQMRRDACRADVERLCKDIQPGQGRLGQCMKKNEASVSQECKDQMAKMRDEMRQRMQAFDEACKGDVEKFCKNVQLGHGRMASCLRDNSANLSAACKDEMAKMDERHKQMRERMHSAAEACKGDVEQYCKDVQPGGGRVGKCLKTNEGKLSAACKAALQGKKS